MLKSILGISVALFTLVSFQSPSAFADPEQCATDLLSMQSIVNNYGTISGLCKKLDPSSARYASAQQLARQIEDAYPLVLDQCYSACAYDGYVQQTGCTHMLSGACP